MTSPAEHDCFARMTEHIRKAADEAAQMVHLRADQSHLWEAIHQNLLMMNEKLYRVAQSGVRQ